MARPGESGGGSRAIAGRSPLLAVAGLLLRRLPGAVSPLLAAAAHRRRRRTAEAAAGGGGARAGQRCAQGGDDANSSCLQFGSRRECVGAPPSGRMQPPPAPSPPPPMPAPPPPKPPPALSSPPPMPAVVPKPRSQPSTLRKPPPAKPLTREQLYALVYEVRRRRSWQCCHTADPSPARPAQLGQRRSLRRLALLGPRRAGASRR